jgi:hypothetical protein
MIFFSSSKKHRFLNLCAITESALLFTKIMSFLVQNIQAVFGAI